MSTYEESRGNWIFGLILLVIGVIFIIENFTDINIWGKVWNLWPVILLIWGLKEIWNNKSIFFGIIIIAIGIIFLAKYFFNFIISDNIWKFWPVLIIAIGIDQVFKSLGGDRIRKKSKKKIKEEEEI